MVITVLELRCAWVAILELLVISIAKAAIIRRLVCEWGDSSPVTLIDSQLLDVCAF